MIEALLLLAVQAFALVLAVVFAVVAIVMLIGWASTLRAPLKCTGCGIEMRPFQATLDLDDKPHCPRCDAEVTR